MDNLDYLNKISTESNKSAKASNDDRLLSSAIIKILIGGAAALVLIIILGLVLGGTSSRTIALYESFHLRLQNLSADNGPIATYVRDVKSSQLRAITGTLRSTLSGASREFSAILPDLNVDPALISESVATSEADILAAYTNDLHNAKLNGLLDRTFASSTTLQISLLIAIGSEILERGPPDDARAIIEKTITDLQILHAQFVEVSNNSN